MTKQNFSSWVLFILLSVIWGSSFILMKKSAEHLSGWQIGAIRIFSAGLVFLPFAIFHVFSIPLKKLPLVVLSGLLGNLFPAFLFAIAIERKVNSSLAGILNSLTPLFVVVIGLLFFGLKVSRRTMLGVLVGLVGLVVLSLSKGKVAVNDLGLTLLILLATLFYGLNVNIVGKYLQGINPVKMATVSLAFVAIPASFILWQQHVFSIARYDETARWSIATAALLGVTGSALATALFYQLIQKAGGLFASLVTYAIPVVAIIWGLVANEDVTPVQVACLALILGGVYLANKKNTKKEAVED
ncbi:MAG TPA: DMT family transporter [Flavisolibacter sp.]|nr:DMT family transporter [Flavisolibacter sp.]